MRDVVFLVADGSMEQMLRGFFSRPAAHTRLGCAPFVFDAAQDVIVAARRDPEVYRLSHELLRPYLSTHDHAVVMLDNDWEGSPGPSKIHEQVSERMRGSWEQFAVIVLDPELEAWVWQENQNVATALGCPTNFREILRRSGHWPAGRPKPKDPKDALQHLRIHHRADRSKAVFNRVAAQVSVKGCVDAAYQLLRDTLRDWFPEETL